MNTTAQEYWLQTLQGQTLPPEQQHDPASQEAGMIRQLLMQQIENRTRQFAPPDSRETAQHWQNLQQRLKAASTPALPDAVARNQKTYPAANEHHYLLAAAIIVLGTSLALQQRTLDTLGVASIQAQQSSAIVLRGDDERQTLHAEAPEILANALIQQLKSAGLPYQVQPVNHGVQVLARIPPASPVRQWLFDNKVTLPAHGRINLIITTR